MIMIMINLKVRLVQRFIVDRVMLRERIPEVPQPECVRTVTRSLGRRHTAVVSLTTPGAGKEIKAETRLR